MEGGGGRQTAQQHAASARAVAAFQPAVAVVLAGATSADGAAAATAANWSLIQARRVVVHWISLSTVACSWASAVGAPRQQEHRRRPRGGMGSPKHTLAPPQVGAWASAAQGQHS